MGVEGRVLLVEDRADWRKRLAKYLELEGYFFEIAKSHAEALDMLVRNAFDVVLVDLRLVDWDETNYQGMELLPRIKALREENGTQAIVVTAYPTTDNVRDAFSEYGVADFFMKADFDPQKFKRALQDAIVKAHEERQEILKTK